MKAAKDMLRKSIAEKLKRLTAEEKQLQSQTIFEKLISTKEFQNSSRISIYLSTDDEVSTIPIIKKIFELNKLCFVPRYNKNVMEMVRLSSMQDYEQLPVTKWNIKQPLLTDVRENALETGGLDLIICPGVAFTTKGRRLGHGKGYYDTFLHTCKKLQPNRPFATIALAFQEQVLDEVPVHDHDFILDSVLSGGTE